jgi:hypothetical protein
VIAEVPSIYVGKKTGKPGNDVVINQVCFIL